VLVGVSTKSTKNHYSRKAINPNPQFNEPKRDSIRPFVRKITDRVKGFTTSNNFKLVIANAKQSGKIKRYPVQDRINAIASLLPAVCFHYDALMKRSNASVTTLAGECGLKTETKRTAEDKFRSSISRARRGLIYLRQIGLIEYTSKHCQVTGGYFPSDINLTDLFFEAIDISKTAIEDEIKSKTTWENKKRAKAGLPKLFRDELIAHLWDNMKNRFIEYRIKRKAQGEKRIQALRDSERDRAAIKKIVQLQIQKEIIAGTFPKDLRRAQAEIEHRTNERMKLSRSKIIKTYSPTAA